MIEKEDFSKYLSVDNGKGLLIKKNDAFILEQYGFNYKNYSSLNDLILMISKYLDDHYEDDSEELEEVLNNLLELHYYHEVNK